MAGVSPQGIFVSREAQGTSPANGGMRIEQQRGARKERRPFGLLAESPGASLFVRHRPLRICSVLTPRHRAIGAQHHAKDRALSTLTLPQIRGDVRKILRGEPQLIGGQHQ